MGRIFKYAKTELQYSGATAKPKFMIIEFLPEQEGELTYTGEELFPTWKNLDPLKVSIEGELSATNAGEHFITVTPTGNFAWSDMSQTPKKISYIIKRKKVSVVPTQKGTLIYNRYPQTPQWNNFNANELVIGGTYKDQINANDSYYATFTPDSNHCWSDETFGPRASNWKIDYLRIVRPSLLKNSFTYDGKVHTPTVANFNSIYTEKDYDLSATNVGNYDLVVKITDRNVLWVDYERDWDTYEHLYWSIEKLEIPTLEQDITTLPKLAVTQNASWNSGLLASAPKIKDYQTIFNQWCYFFSDDNLERPQFKFDIAEDYRDYLVVYLTVCLKDKNNTQWQSGGKEDKTFTCRVQKIQLTAPPVNMTQLHTDFDVVTGSATHPVQKISDKQYQIEWGTSSSINKIEGKHFDFTAIESAAGLDEDYWDTILKFTTDIDYSEPDQFGAVKIVLQERAEKCFILKDIDTSTGGWRYEFKFIKFQFPVFYRGNTNSFSAESIANMEPLDFFRDKLKVVLSPEMTYDGFNYDQLNSFMTERSDSLEYEFDSYLNWNEKGNHTLYLSLKNAKWDYIQFVQNTKGTIDNVTDTEARISYTIT